MDSLGFIERFAALGALALVIIGATTWIKRAQRHREMEHLERLKAMELGIVPRLDGLNWPVAAACIGIGAGVPVGSFAVCWLASLTAHVPHGIWIAPVFVSFSAINASKKLAYRALDQKPWAKQTDPFGSAKAGKPEFDPDAFDVVGSRG